MSAGMSMFYTEDEIRDLVRQEVTEVIGKIWPLKVPNVCLEDNEVLVIEVDTTGWDAVHRDEYLKALDRSFKGRLENYVIHPIDETHKPLSFIKVRAGRIDPRDAQYHDDIIGVMLHSDLLQQPIADDKCSTRSVSWAAEMIGAGLIDPAAALSAIGLYTDDTSVSQDLIVAEAPKE